MPPYVLEGILPLVALFAMGSFGLAGMRMWLKAKSERLREGGGENVAQLNEQVEALWEQIQLLRDSQTELHERLDFTERLLTRARDESPSG